MRFVRSLPMTVPSVGCAVRFVLAFASASESSLSSWWWVGSRCAACNTSHTRCRPALPGRCAAIAMCLSFRSWNRTDPSGAIGSIDDTGDRYHYCYCYDHLAKALPLFEALIRLKTRQTLHRRAEKDCRQKSNGQNRAEHDWGAQDRTDTGKQESLWDEESEEICDKCLIVVSLNPYLYH